MQKRMNMKGFLLIIGTMLVAFLVLHMILMNNLNQKREEEHILRQSLTGMEEANKTLTAQLKAVGTEDYIVSSAKVNYAYMNRNDIRFEFTNPEALYAYTEEELKILMDDLAE